MPGDRAASGQRPANRPRDGGIIRGQVRRLEARPAGGRAAAGGAGAVRGRHHPAGYGRGGVRAQPGGPCSHHRDRPRRRPHRSGGARGRDRGGPGRRGALPAPRPVDEGRRLLPARPRSGALRRHAGRGRARRGSLRRGGRGRTRGRGLRRAAGRGHGGGGAGRRRPAALRRLARQQADGPPGDPARGRQGLRGATTSCARRSACNDSRRARWRPAASSPATRTAG